MGALPKRRTSTRRKGKRRLHKRVSLVNLIACSHCGARKLPHTLCRSCGRR